MSKEQKRRVPRWSWHWLLLCGATITVWAQQSSVLDPVRTLMEQGKFRQAYLRTVEILENFPQCYDCYPIVAWLADTLDRVEEVVPLLQKGIAVFPKDVPLRQILAHIYFQQEQYESAVAVLAPVQQRLHRQARKLYAAAYAQWALQAYQRQYFDRAVERIQIALRFDSTEVDYLTLLFTLGWKLQRCDLIQTYLPLLKQLQPRIADFYLVAAQCAVRANRLPEAEALLQLGVQRVGSNREMERFLAQVRLFRGKWQSADRLLQKLLRRYPQDEELWMQRVDFWLYLAKYDSARAVLRQMIRRFPKNAAAYWKRIGTLYEQEGKFAEARTVYRQARQEGALQNREWLQIVGQTFVQEQQPDSLRQLLRFAAVRKDTLLLLWLLGNCYDRQSRNDSAAYWYWQAVRSFPDSLRWRRFLIFLLWSQQDSLWLPTVAAMPQSVPFWSDILRWKWMRSQDTTLLLHVWEQAMERIGTLYQHVQEVVQNNTTERAVDWESREYAVLERLLHQLFRAGVQQLRPKKLHQVLLQWVEHRYPRNVFAYTFYARWLLQQQRVEEAAAVLDRAVTVAPRHPELHQLRAEIAQRQQDRRKALLEILRALQQAPEDTTLYQDAIRLALQAKFAAELARKWEIQYEGAATEQPALRKALIQLYRALGWEQKAKALESE